MAAFPMFARVVGGELPLPPAEAALWSTAPAAEWRSSAVLTAIGCSPEASLWLRYGRSAFGLALDLAGIGDGAEVAFPGYMCSVIFAKARRRRVPIAFYPLRPDLTADRDGLAAAAGRATAVFTCSYFGSVRVDASLAEHAGLLAGLANRPWVIEDRVMAFPDPRAMAAAGTRSDFVITSLRKIFPVPDGAVLWAASARARAALNRWRGDRPERPAATADSAVADKIRAKVKRHAWLSQRPCADDPAANGRAESLASEARIDATADDDTADGRPGTAGSAAWLAGRDLAVYRDTVRRRSRRVAEAIAAEDRRLLPLDDCVGNAVPLHVADRVAFLAALAARGVFLPVHWPTDAATDPCPSSRRWFAREVSLPLPATADEGDVDHLIAQVAPLARRHAA